MSKPTVKPRVLWILQKNQVTPLIIEFLKLIQSGMKQIDLTFMISRQDKKEMGMAKPLNPVPFTISKMDEGRTKENYFKKRAQIQNSTFDDGLKVWRVLLADDLGAGQVSRTSLNFETLTNVKGIILQIPTPLGSAIVEELTFYTWVKLARDNNVFVAGYELLPLDTRWTLLPSMVDGVITSNPSSHMTLTSDTADIKGKIWQLPRHEGKIFAPGPSPLWQNGLQSPYTIQMQHPIKPETLVLYVPHNVAMSNEYKRLIEALSPLGKHIHLMISIGKDQIRGTHTHEEIIKTLSRKELNKFSSYSFHDLNAPWEMVGAGAVVAAATCFATKMAEANGIPCCVMDEYVSPRKIGYLEIVNNYKHITAFVKSKIAEQLNITDMSHILYEIVLDRHPKIEV